MSENRTLARERESEREYGEERVDSTVKERGLQSGEGRQAKRTFLEVVGNMSRYVNAKALQEDLQSLGFTPRQPNLKWKRLGDEVPAHKMTE